MDSVFKILVADDDAEVWGNSIKMFLRDISTLELVFAQSPEECRRLIRDQSFAIVLLDISFSTNDSTGISLVPEIQTKQPNAKIFMLSSHDDDLTMVRCLQLGASDFISKRSTQPSEIANVIRGYIAGEARRITDIEAAKDIAAKVGIVLTSDSMLDVFTKVVLAQRNPTTPVLITGETGVGKDVVASAIAAQDSRKAFVAVDCGAIPESLAESEFFGHTKGSFTGADAAKQGKFVLASGGDLFLDEIGNLKRGIQDKLLRALQNKEVTPLGAPRPISVNTRVIAATNENLEELVSKGVFRQDLLERLKGIWIHVPPLRERPEDVGPLVGSIIAKSDKPSLTVAPTCLSLLKCYSWPGNIRELEHLVREMIARVDVGPLTIRHLPDQFRARLASDLKLEPGSTEDHKLGMQVTVPLEGAFQEAERAFVTTYLLGRFAQLGPNASKRALARDLKLARTTLDRFLSEHNIVLQERAQ